LDAVRRVSRLALVEMRALVKVELSYCSFAELTVRDCPLLQTVDLVGMHALQRLGLQAPRLWGLGVDDTPHLHHIDPFHCPAIKELPRELTPGYKVATAHPPPK
jgi:hypothetical protein